MTDKKTRSAAEKKAIYKRFERAGNEDPDVRRQRIYDNAIARRGQEWFDEHKSEIDAEIEGARALMGL